MRAFPATLLTLLLAACASPRLEEHAWIEVKSPNFTIYTDLDRDDAVQLSQDIELFRAVLMKVTNAMRFAPRVPTRIYAFTGPFSFLQFADSKWMAGYFRPLMRENLVVLDASGTNGLNARLILFHEYTHFVVHNQNQIVLPIWYDEGFAEFMASTLLKSQNIVIGAAPMHRKNTAMTQVALDYDKILRTRSFDGWSNAARDMFYVESWEIVHYLMLGPGKQLGNVGVRMARYAEAVERGEDEDRAFQAAFGMSIEQLQDEVRAYHGYRQIPATSAPRSAFQSAQGSEVREVPPAEMAERLGWLAMFNNQTDVAMGFFERALALDASRSRAHAGLGDVYLRADQVGEADLQYRLALDLAPNDYENQLERAEAFHYLADVKGQRDLIPAAREHYARAIELAPDIPEGHLMLARTYLLTQEDPTPGLRSAERAQALLPGQGDVQLGLAQLYARVGKRAEAIACARRALLLSEGDDKAAADLLAELGQPVEQTPPPRALSLPMSRWLAALFVALLAACASPRLEQRTWIEVKSPSFTIYTDLGRDDAVQLSWELETLSAVLRKLADAQGFQPHVPTRIFVFATSDAFQQFAGDERVRGTFQPGLRENLVALDGSAAQDGEAKAVFLRGTARFVVRSQHPLPPPLWYEEGFAELVSTLRVQDESVLIGVAPPRRKGLGSFVFLPSLDKILRAQDLRDWNELMREMLRFQSWQLVHYLMLDPRRPQGGTSGALARYVDAVESGQDVEPALRASFATSVAELDAAVRAHHRPRPLPTATLPARDFAPGQGARVRALESAEIAEALGRFALVKGNLQLARGYYQRALAADASRAHAYAGLALVYLQLGRVDEATSQTADALELAPDDFEIHLDLALLDHQRAESQRNAALLRSAREHYRRAIALAPELPESHLMLGLTWLLADEDPTPGVASAERARELLPGHDAVQLGLARLYAKAGRRDDALVAAQRALRLSLGENEAATKLLAELGEPTSAAPAGP